LGCPKKEERIEKKICLAFLRFHASVKGTVVSTAQKTVIPFLTHGLAVVLENRNFPKTKKENK